MRKTKGKNNKFLTSAILNDDTFCDFMYRLKNVAVSMFEWQNLPSSMDSRYLEETLFYNGQAILLYDENYGFINTKGSSNGKLNIYGLPVSFNCYSYTYQAYRNLYTGLKNENEQNKSCVLVMNNWDRRPTAPMLELFSYRLYLAQRTIDTNIQAQRTPIMITGSDKQRLMLENLYSQYDGNAPFIFGDKDQLNSEMLKAIKTDAPYIEDKVSKYKKEILNEALSYLGINSVDIEKKERMITDEANSNNEYVNLNLMARLIPRQKACEQFNELFEGLIKEKISVRLRSDLSNIIKSVNSIVDDYVDSTVNDLVKNKIEGGVEDE